MKLYQSFGPNPRVVTMYIAERGIDVPRVFMDIQAGENRTPKMLALNPSGGSPFLEIAGGTVLPDSFAICEYFEDHLGRSALLGETAAERAQTRAMMRRIDQSVIVPMSNAFRSAEGLPMFQSRMFCCPEAAEGNKAYCRDGLMHIEKQFGDGPWLLGERFSLADIVLYCFADFGGMVVQPLPSECSKLSEWTIRVRARNSAEISANPQNGL
jgi:glutathione S-transferase